MLALVVLGVEQVAEFSCHCVTHSVLERYGILLTHFNFPFGEMTIAPYDLAMLEIAKEFRL